jgi:uroporphyrinogen-III decarboxylase
MSLSTTSSRERMLAALNCEQPDHTPCSFMLFKSLQTHSRDALNFVERQIEMGLDTVVMLPPRSPVVINDHYNLHGLPVSFSSEVKIVERIEAREGERWPLLHKEYQTPAGILRAEVRQTDDWRWGDHVPFLDDYLSSRSRKFLVTGSEDLEALQFLLAAPTQAEIASLNSESEPMMDLAKRKDLLIGGGWGVGADMLGWIFGLEAMVLSAYDRPQFLHALLGMIAEWNRQRMEILLDTGIDLFIKRAWYETCHFWTPTSFREFIFPILKADVDLAHQAGAKFGYIVTSNTMPLLEQYAEAGVDVLIGVDPKEWDLAKTKSILKQKVCLWGGVNGHLTVEQGAEREVRQEVRLALKELAAEGGFILSPVDNVRQSNELAMRNVSALIDEWRTSQGL